MTKIPLLILNGTLGSGKTTLVKHLLRSPEFAGSFLIENEFASVNIDREAIADEHDDEIYEISGSCICCSTGEELEAALEAVIERGWQKPVILEATGMANSAILMQRLFLNPRFVEHFQILQAVLMVDGAEEMAHSLTSGLQLEAQLADVIVVNKADLAADELPKLEQRLRELNPEAIVMPAVRAAVEPARFVSRPSNAETTFARVFPQVQDIKLDEASYAVLELNGPLEPELVKRALRPEAFPAGTSLRRAKGFFQDLVGGYWQVEATAKHIELSRLKQPKPTVIIAIGSGITKQALREVLT